METPYKRTEIGYMGIICYSAIAIAGMYSLIKHSADWKSILAEILIILFVVIVSNMTIEVNQESLSFCLGFGMLRKTIHLDDIDTTEIGDPLPPLDSGIRPTFNGLIYNVAGTESVKIKLKNKKKYILGTNDSKNLLKYLNQTNSQKEI